MAGFAHHLDFVSTVMRHSQQCLMGHNMRHMCLGSVGLLFVCEEAIERSPAHAQESGGFGLVSTSAAQGFFHSGG